MPEDPKIEWLWQQLDLRNRDQQRSREIDEAIWERLGAEYTVLVSDLSGFTRVTRSHGILHFLAIHHKCVTLCAPEVEKLNGTLVKTQADNMTALFSDPATAVEAAVRINRLMETNNREVDEASRIGICIGIAHGRVIRTDYDMFGDAVNIAYKLGEDVAKTGEVLVHQPTAASAKSNPAYSFSPVQEVSVGKIAVPYQRLIY